MPPIVHRETPASKSAPLLRSRACVRAAHAAALALLLAWIDVARAADADDCVADPASRVLVAARTSAADARAMWLDAGRLRWPGAPRDGHYRLLAGRGPLEHVGERIVGADASLALATSRTPLDAAAAARFAWTGDGVELEIADARSRLPRWLVEDLLLVREDADGRVLDATHVQAAAALDALYADAAATRELGARRERDEARLALWAPTARRVVACVWRSPGGPPSVQPLRRDDASGIWNTRFRLAADAYVAYLVDVHVPGAGLVRNRVTDPYSTSLDADSRRTWLGDLDDADVVAPDWNLDRAPRPIAAATDLVVYELHLRDFSIADASVPPPVRGRYLAFAQPASDGMKALRALAAAGITDVHLLPLFDFASVPERDCDVRSVDRARDCYNWGYDPWHYGAPEGSYASDAADGRVRIREFRRMVQGLHAAGLRVGMDLVYNHTSASGQDPNSLLDRIVPGYYQRLDATGRVERSTCCANTATEHRMMERLMIDTAVRWARDYHVDSFRFDLMGHQPRAAMERLQAAVDAATGRHVPLLGEGWNFGEVKDGARFVQASQRSLGGSGIATFDDRLRDAARGGTCCERGIDHARAQGWATGLYTDPNGLAGPASRSDLARAADLVRVGLAGALRAFAFQSTDGTMRRLDAIDWHGEPAGYASEPGEVVTYVENHDNETLYDIAALRLPLATPSAERARVQVLALALVAFGQGIAYFHAGGELLRSKALVRDSFDAGDTVNAIDWSGRDNGFGPAAGDASRDPAVARVLADHAIRPTAHDIAWTRAAFLDLLRIRAGTTLLRLRSAADVRARLSFPNAGPAQEPALIVGRIDGAGYAGATFDALMYFVNADHREHSIELPDERGRPWRLHPLQASPLAADARPREQARYDRARGRFTIPPRTALAYVIEPE